MLHLKPVLFFQASNKGCNNISLDSNAFESLKLQIYVYIELYMPLIHLMEMLCFGLKDLRDLGFNLFHKTNSRITSTDSALV